MTCSVAYFKLTLNSLFKSGVTVPNLARIQFFCAIKIGAGVKLIEIQLQSLSVTCGLLIFRNLSRNDSVERETFLSLAKFCVQTKFDLYCTKHRLYMYFCFLLLNVEIS